MRVLVACEFSGVVRQAFEDAGHDAWSCDLLPTESFTDKHIQEDVIPHLNDGWDLLIAHPPCTYLALSGSRWWPDRREEQEAAIDFFMKFIGAPIPRIAVENPIGVMSTEYRPPDQIIQPWQFGHGESKATCLWLKGLGRLMSTGVVRGRLPSAHRMSPGPNRGMERSRTYQGIADAMAAQWGSGVDSAVDMALADIDQFAATARDSTTKRNDAIRRARENGATYRQIAQAAGMWPAGIAKILEKDR